MSIIAQLRTEVGRLRDLVEAKAGDGSAVTPFYAWRVRDSIAHLVTIDRLARLALSDNAAFEAARAAFGEGVQAKGEDTRPGAPFRRIAAYEASLWGHLSWPQLLDAWADGFEALCAAAAGRPLDDKVNWFAAPMRVETLLAARQMEVWAYGQDVFDLYGVTRQDGDELRNVVEFALRTYGFSFANRGLQPPEQKPAVVLASPSGEEWAYNDPAAPDRVEGSAVDFCLVATQRRHVEDTGLVTSGPGAATWMRIAQCIAGAPADGPAPGERASRRP